MDFFDFWWILGGFWEAKTNRKSIFGRTFGHTFFKRVLVSILDGFLEARNLKNSNFPKEKQWFSQNRRFRKKCKKSSILGPFSEAKMIKIQFLKTFSKTSFFQHRFLAVFFRVLTILTRFWEASEPQKIQENCKKSIKNRFWDAFGARLGFQFDFGTDFRAIWNDFGWILE